MNTKQLISLPCGQKARVTALTVTGKERRRLLDLGLIPGTAITALYKSPSGDPVAYLFRNTVIALRNEDAQKIFITASSEERNGFYE